MELKMVNAHFSPSTRRSTKKTKSDGSVLLEFALIVPILLLLTLGGTDLLLATSAKSNLSYVAQATASCAAKIPAPDMCENLSAYANSVAHGVGLNSPVTVPQITYPCAGCVTVQVNVTTAPISPFFPAIDLSAEATAFPTGTQPANENNAQRKN
jgi:Flp pilus assembly protein TadG